MHRNGKKLLALILCTVMLLALLPLGATAEADKRIALDREIPAKDGEKAAEVSTESTEKSISNAAVHEGVNNFTITTGGETLYRPFTPSVTGLYRIYSTGSEDTYGYVTDGSMKTIAQNEDGGEGYNFEIKAQLTAGVTYYIGTRYHFSYTTGTIPVTIRRYATNACGENLTWELETEFGELLISGYGDMWDYEENQAPWHSQANLIRWVNLPNGLTSVGDYAFADMPYIEEAQMPDTVRRIGYAAFARSESLQSATSPDSLEEIDMYAFFYTGLICYSVPKSVSYIGPCAFLSCMSMEPYDFEIDEENPYYMAEDGVICTKDGSALVMYLTSISDYEFTVPEGVASIEPYAFRNAQSLMEVTLASGVQTVGQFAFQYCTDLEQITIPDTVTKIERGAFQYCDSLRVVNYLGTEETRNERLTINNGNNYNAALLNATWYYQALACGDDLTWKFDAELSELIIYGDGDMWDFEEGKAPWFAYANEIRRISLPVELTSVGDYAFADLPNIETVKLPDTLRRIGCAAFAGDNLLYSVSALDSLEEIDAYAFYNTGLSHYSVPISVSYIGPCAFLSCPSLEPYDFMIDEENLFYKAEDGVIFSKDGSKLVMCLSTAAGTEFTVPNGVTSIEPYAFCDSTALEKITIPDTVTEIGQGAFLHCDALSDVYYPGSSEACSDTLVIQNDDGGNSALLNATWHYREKLPFDGTIEWNADDLQFKSTTPYVVYNGSAFTPRFTVLDAEGNVVDSENYTYEYRENTNAGTAYVIVTFTDIYSGTARAWFKIYLPATTSTAVQNVDDGIYLTWSAVDGAAGYVIYRRAWSSTTNGWTDFVRWNNTTELTWTDTTVFAGSRYQYGIKAYFAQRVDPVTGATIGGNVGDNYNLGQVGPLKTTVRITTRKLNSLKAGDKQITVKWSGSTVFTGYQVQYATNETFTKGVKTVRISDPKTYSTTLKSLKNGTVYYVRVRSYHVFEGMTYCGQWSNVLSVAPGSGQTVTPGT